MNEIKVKTAGLLERVKSNRKTHRELFLKAQEVYRQDMIDELDRMLLDARGGKEIRRFITMPEPQDHTADYDRVIEMLLMTVDEEIVVQSHEFDQYVMDNWNWKQAALTANNFYASKAIK